MQEDEKRRQKEMKCKKFRIKKEEEERLEERKFISAHLPFYLPPSARLSSDWSS